MIKDYFTLAFRNLRNRGLRSWLTVIGIFIGIAAVVSLISLGNGLQEAVTGQLGSLSIDILTLQNKGSGFGPPGSTVVKKLNNNDLKIVENINGVDLIITRLIRVGSLEFNDISGFGFAASIPEDKEPREFIYKNFDIEAEVGRLLDSNDKGKILLGNHFLDTEDFEKKLRVGKTVKINGKDFEVVGILAPSGNIQINHIVLMMSDDMEKLFDTKDEYDLIVIKVSDKDRIEEIAEEIERKLRNDRNEKLDEESFSVETPAQILNSVNLILNIINLIIVGIAAISLFVGGIGIANTMYTSVIERTKEIGIMKAIGARNKDILMIFLIESGLLGLVGGIVGAIIGLLGAIGVSTLANNALNGNLFSVSISYPLLIGAVSFSFFVGILSGILPAIQSSKLNVVDALRS